MNILYFDCFSGISGDMTLGALIDLGADLKLLLEELKKLNLTGYKIKVSKKSSYGLAGADVEVILDDQCDGTTQETDPPGLEDHRQDHGQSYDHGHGEHQRHSRHHVHGEEHSHRERNLSDIENLLQASGLSPWVKETSKGIFREIALAEAKVHGSSVEEVHFHEVGAVDSLVDIVGSVVCLELLGKPKVYASPLHEGRGFIYCRHGRLPVPVPAVMAMLSDSPVPIPVITEDVQTELVTPTGLGLLKYLSADYGPMPPITVKKVGYGLGKRDIGRFNALRLVIGSSWAKENTGSALEPGLCTEKIVLLETNIDDMSGEIAGYLMERLLELEALDVFYTPVYMKKNRPGIMLSVLATADKEKQLAACLFAESTTLGVRRHLIDRYCLERRSEILDIGIGTVRVKVAEIEGGKKIAPEYDDCRKLAQTTGLPLREIYQMVLASL